MQFLKFLRGLVSRAPIDAGSGGKGSLSISQIQELELDDPELQKHLMHGDESLLKYPPFLKGLPARVPGKYLLSNHAAKVRALSSGIGLPPSEFNRLIMPVLDGFASFAHMLPASQAHHHRGSGGLLAHSLEVAVHALNACQVTVFDHDKYPAMRIKRRDKWSVAAVLAALLHDVGKPLFDLQVTDASTDKIWQPVANTIPEWAEEHNVDRYFFRWNPNRHDVHKHLSTTMIDRLLHKDLRLWLMEGGQDLYLAMINAIACQDEKSILTGLVIKADSTSVAADLRKYGGDASGQSAMGIGVPVASLVVDTMRHLKSSGNWLVNEPGSRIWILGDGIYIAWVAGVKDITEELYQKGVKAVPRSSDALGEMLLDHNILERSPEGSIYWPVFPDVLSKGGGKLIKLKCVRLAASNLLFPFEPVPQSIAGVVGEGEHELRFEANSNEGIGLGAEGELPLQAGDPMAAFPAPGASASQSMEPMFSLGSATIDSFAPTPAAEIFSVPTLAVPDFSAPTGGLDPFSNLLPKTTAPDAAPMPAAAPAPEQRPSPATTADPRLAHGNPRTKPANATLEKLVPGTLPAPQIKIVGAQTKPESALPGIVVTGTQQPNAEGIKIGGRQVAAKSADKAKQPGPGNQKLNASQLAQKTSSKPVNGPAGEWADLPRVGDDDAQRFSGDDEYLGMPAPLQNGLPQADDVESSLSAPSGMATVSTGTAGPDSDTARDAEYAYNFADIDDDVLEMAGMAIPDRSLVQHPAEKEPAEKLVATPTRTSAVHASRGTQERALESPIQVERPVNPVAPRMQKSDVRMVIPPELAGMDEFSFGDLSVDMSLDHLGDLPVGSPISVSLPKDMERLLYASDVSLETVNVEHGYDVSPAHPTVTYDQAPEEFHGAEGLDREDHTMGVFDLPVMSSSVMLPEPEPEPVPIAAPVMLELPPPQAIPETAVEFNVAPLQVLQPKPEAPAPVREVAKRKAVQRAAQPGVGPGISISKNSAGPSRAIKVGQPRKPREQLQRTPVDIVPLPEESFALAGPFNGYECSVQRAAEYEEFLALTPELTKSLKWYAEHLDKNVSMVSFKPNLEFAGSGFIFDDLPRLQKAMWLWDDFTGTMNRKAPKSVMLNCYLGEVFEYLTKGKYQHSLAAAKNEVEAQNLRRIAVAALALCKESELNGRRVVSIPPRKLSELSNALQVDEPTLKRALIATHQYLLVRNNHVIELVDK